MYVSSLWSLPPTPSPLTPLGRHEQRAELPVLRGSFPLLSALFTVLCPFRRSSLRSPHPVLPPLHILICPLCLCSFSAGTLTCAAFLDSGSLCFCVEFVFLFLTHFPLCDVHWVHLRHCVAQLPSFPGRVILHCTRAPPLLCRFTFPRAGCSRVPAVVSTAAVNAGIRVSFWIRTGFWGYMPSREIAGRYDSSVYSFLSDVHTIFHSGCTSFTFPQHCKKVLFSTPCTAFILCRFFDGGHCGRCEVIPHCSFDLHFSNNSWCWVSFYLLLGHLYVFFGEMSV